MVSLAIRCTQILYLGVVSIFICMRDVNLTAKEGLDFTQLQLDRCQHRQSLFIQHCINMSPTGPVIDIDEHAYISDS